MSGCAYVQFTSFSAYIHQAFPFIYRPQEQVKHIDQVQRLRAGRGGWGHSLDFQKNDFSHLFNISDALRTKKLSTQVVFLQSRSLCRRIRFRSLCELILRQGSIFMQNVTQNRKIDVVKSEYFIIMPKNGNFSKFFAKIFFFRLKMKFLHLTTSISGFYVKFCMKIDP